MDFPPLLTEREILAQCDLTLYRTTCESEIAFILKLSDEISSHSWTRESVLAILAKLSDFGSKDEHREMRKWRCASIHNAIQDVVQRDFVDAMYELGEVWLLWGCPEDVPAIIQEGYLRNRPADTTELDAKDYLDTCVDWVEKERRLLQANEES